MAGAEFDWDERTARNYMRLAEVFGDKTETVSVLQPTTLYLLSAKSTPPKIVAETIARLKVGERIDQDEVRAKVQEARAHARRERAEARLTTRQRKHKLASREKRELALLEHQQQPARDREAAARAVTAWINLVGAATATALVKLQQQHLFFDEELRAQVAAIEQEEAS